MDALADLDFEAWHAQQKEYFKQLNKHLSEPVYCEDDGEIAALQYEDDADAEQRIHASHKEKWTEKLGLCRQTMSLSI